MTVKKEKSNKQPKLIVILENATLETVKVGKGRGDYQLLNCDDHHTILRNNGRNIADSRPDITHQVSDRYLLPFPSFLCVMNRFY
jgi:rRNA small subunit pseudouridine methyltransferase Nep1